MQNYRLEREVKKENCLGEVHWWGEGPHRNVVSSNKKKKKKKKKKKNEKEKKKEEEEEEEEEKKKTKKKKKRYLTDLWNWESSVFFEEGTEF